MASKSGEKIPMDVSLEAQPESIPVPLESIQTNNLNIENLSDDDSSSEEDNKLNISTILATARLSSTKKRFIFPLTSTFVNPTLETWKKLCKFKQQVVIKRYIQYYNQWKIFLTNGFHLCFHGLGSKKAILEHFFMEMISPFEPVLIINGYRKHISTRQVLASLAYRLASSEQEEELYKQEETTSQLSHVLKLLDNSEFFLYILVHNVDQLLLNNPELWDIIRLHFASRTRLVFSLDNFVSPIFLKTSSISNLLWIECSVGIPYTEEVEQLPKRTIKSRRKNKEDFEEEDQIDDGEEPQEDLLSSEITLDTTSENYKLYQISSGALKSIKATSKLLFCIIAIALINSKNSTRGVSSDVIFDRCNNPCRLYIRKRREFEMELGYLQSAGLINIDYNSMIPFIKSQLPKDVMAKLVNEYTDLWQQYVGQIAL